MCNSRSSDIRGGGLPYPAPSGGLPRSEVGNTVIFAVLLRGGAPGRQAGWGGGGHQAGVVW